MEMDNVLNGYLFDVDEKETFNSEIESGVTAETGNGEPATDQNQCLPVLSDVKMITNDERGSEDFILHEIGKKNIIQEQEEEQFQSQIQPENTTEMDIDNSSKFQCNQCAQCFGNNSELITHFVEVHILNEENKDFTCKENVNEEPKLPDKSDQNQRKDLESFQDVDCIIVFENVNANMMTEPNEASTSLDLINDKKPRKRIRKKTTPKEVYQCDHCPDVFKYRRSLDYHLKIHGIGLTQCPFCLEYFIKWKEHMKVHIRDNNSFVCRICKVGFQNAELLALHTAEHLARDNKNYLCKFCTGAFATRSQFIHHLKTHKEN